MILDPRLVPWADVVPGVGVALVLAIAGFFTWTWRTTAFILITAAPVAGWTVCLWKLQGRLPAIPPADATMWVFYFAVGAVAVAAATLALSRYRWWVTVATVISIAFIAAIWSTLLKAVAVPDETGTSMGGSVLFLAWIGVLLAIDTRKAEAGIAAEYVPWLVALLTASVALALTGTASLSTVALALLLCALPAAITVLVRTLSGSVYAIPSRSPGNVDDDPANGITTKPMPYRALPQVQAVTLPLAATLPLFVLSGSEYAYTPWMVSLLIVAAPVAGLLALRVFSYLLGRRQFTLTSRQATESLAIVVALVVSAIPAAIAAYQVISAAAAEDPFY